MLAYSASGPRSSPAPLPDPRSSSYKGADDIETLLYIRDVSSQIQKEHQSILEALDDVKERLGRLEKKIGG